MASIIYGESGTGTVTRCRDDEEYTWVKIDSTPVPEKCYKEPPPAKLAWTEMNTGWKKGKRK